MNSHFAGAPTEPMRWGCVSAANYGNKETILKLWPQLEGQDGHFLLHCGGVDFLQHCFDLKGKSRIFHARIHIGDINRFVPFLFGHGGYSEPDQLQGSG